jgi:hypothetical protein
VAARLDSAEKRWRFLQGVVWWWQSVIDLCKPATTCIHCCNVCSVSEWIEAAIDGCSKSGVAMTGWWHETSMCRQK